ncbi:MAG: hypothetical protein HZA72_02310 [Candidatus Omnitrophica bacterium]|nr:hypothetical protein [Candidatus Omnitrophota bacterium]
MGLGPAVIKLNLELWQRGLFKAVHSVMDMGSQELLISQADFEELVHWAGISNYRKEDFPNLENWPKRPRCSAKPFYAMLGAEKYSCIDLDTGLGAIPIDLNFPLEDKSLYNQYDLVTDYGMNEHVFNTAEAYRTMHRLCKQYGIIVIEQFVYHGNGYYGYEPSFFEGIAAANNYKIFFSSYVIGITKRASAGSLNQFHIPFSSDLLDALDWSKVSEIGISYVMQKQTDSDFRYPYEGQYLSKAYGNHGYRLQFLSNPPSRSYIPISNTLEEAIPGRSLLQQLFKRIIKKIKVF